MRRVVRSSVSFRKALTSRAALVKWTPYRLGSSVAVWVDAMETKSFSFRAGSYVSAWRDLSANNRHLVQAAGASQPQRFDNYIGGNPAVVFSGNLGTFIRNSFGLIPQPFTMAFVLKTFSEEFNQSAMLLASANIDDPTPNASATCINYFSNNNPFPPWNLNQFAGTGTAIDEGEVADDSEYLGVFQFNGALSSQSVNGTNVGSLDVGTRPLSGLEIGAWNNGGNSSSVIMGEALVINRGLTSDERLSLEGYFAWKWNLSGNLPANHRFKNSIPR
jgi:hypothetical protein